jgi:hypothetical protein
MSIWRRLWLPFQEITSSIYNNNQNDETHDIKIIKIPGTTKAATSPDSQSSDENNKIQLIIDDPAEEDALDFQRYSQNLANIIRTTKPKFAVGIFGKWGTGKSTLMRMIERELNPVLILTWNGITQYSEESNKLKSFLKENYGEYPIDSSYFVKENDTTLTFRMEDEKKTLYHKRIHSLSLQLNDKKDRASLTFDGNFIRDFVVKREDDNVLKLFLEQQNKILTVWFDAWRYEREKRLAVIPFLRLIKIALENDLARNTKTQKWEVLREGLKRTFAAFVESTQVSVAVQGSLYQLPQTLKISSVHSNRQAPSISMMNVYHFVNMQQTILNLH